jgi:Uri superfamily endonuclease
MKGSYILVVELEKDQTIQIGKFGKIYFSSGFYAYVGSALNGLEQRINRHLRKDKKTHWHIDYLLKQGKISDIFYKKSDTKKECNFVKKFEEKLLPILNFGSSDCKCRSHLFHGDINDILSVVKKLKMNQYIINQNT